MKKRPSIKEGGEIREGLLSFTDTGKMEMNPGFLNKKTEAGSLMFKTEIGRY